MKISKNSWHYKLVRKCCTFPSQNLCSYFWQLVFSVVVVPLLFLVLIVGTLGIFFAMFIGPFIGEYVVSGVIWTVMTACVAGILYENHKDKTALKNNVAVNYIKAKKDKICPYIEFTE